MFRLHSAGDDEAVGDDARDSRLEIVPLMTLHDKPTPEGRLVKMTNTTLLLLAVILLIVGFPSFLFGVFLAASQANGIEGDVPFRFGVGGLVSVLSALAIKALLQRRNGWF